MLSQNNKLYTWVNVQDQLGVIYENGHWLEGIRIETLRSGMHIYHIPNLREAFPKVGQEKIKEVKEENKENELAKVLSQLEQLAKNPHFRVPFESHEGLSSADISLLLDQGILIRYNEKFYMTELFRLGLGIDKKKGKVKTDF